MTPTKSVAKPRFRMQDILAFTNETYPFKVVTDGVKVDVCAGFVWRSESDTRLAKRFTPAIDTGGGTFVPIKYWRNDVSSVPQLDYAEGILYLKIRQEVGTEDDEVVLEITSTLPDDTDEFWHIEVAELLADGVVNQFLRSDIMPGQAPTSGWWPFKLSIKNAGGDGEPIEDGILNVYYGTVNSLDGAVLVPFIANGPDVDLTPTAPQPLTVVDTTGAFGLVLLKCTVVDDGTTGDGYITEVEVVTEDSTLIPAGDSTTKYFALGTYKKVVDSPIEFVEGLVGDHLKIRRIGPFGSTTWEDFTR